MQMKAFTASIVASILAAQLHALEIEAVAKGKCPFGHDKPSTLAQSEAVEEDQEAHIPLSSIFASGIAATTALDIAHYESIFAVIVGKIDGLSTELKANNNPQGKFVGCLVRLAGHDLMDFRADDPNQGGVDGCIDLQESDNKGLRSCLTEFGIIGSYAEFKDLISLADFLVIIAEAAMARTHRSYDAADPFKEGTLAQQFRDGFLFGRTTATSCEWAYGRMPNPEFGCSGRDGNDGL